MAKIALVMIVKNEVAVIGRCLESVLPLIDEVFIVDTGSTDGTRGLIAEILVINKIPFHIFNKPWVDFATNRNEALELARRSSHCDYILTIDADEVLSYDSGFNATALKMALSADIYNIHTQYGGIKYVRPQLFKLAIPFKYVGVVHEYLEIPEGIEVTTETIGDLYNHPIQDGARSKDPEKYANDAAALVKALQTVEKGSFLESRYTFYLAQSWKDAGNTSQAIKEYLNRAKQGYWNQERYISYLTAGRLRESQDDGNSAFYLYASAHQVCPDRWEAVHGMVKVLRLQALYQTAYHIADSWWEHQYGWGPQYEEAEDNLFVEDWVKTYGFLDELSMVAHYAGNYKYALHIYDLLLTMEAIIPVADYTRIEANRKFTKTAITDG